MACLPTRRWRLLQRFMCETPTGHSPQAQLQGIEGGSRLPRTFKEWFVARENPWALVGFLDMAILASPSRAKATKRNKDAAAGRCDQLVTRSSTTAITSREEKRISVAPA